MFLCLPNTSNNTETIDKKYIKIKQVVYETLPHLNMKFFFLLISVKNFECVSELFHLYKNFSRNRRKLTNTFKLIHRILAKYIQNFIFRWGRVSYTTCIISIYFFIYSVTNNDKFYTKII